MSFSQREVLGIDQLLDSEQLLASKYKVFSNICSDYQLKQLFEKVAAKHQTHYDTLLQLLHE